MTNQHSPPPPTDPPPTDPPPTDPPSPENLNKLFHEWFVRYNPLYFFSAGCVLLGLFLVSQGFGEMGWERGNLILTLITQIYEISLIASAALLFRQARQYRPAVILGLLSGFFLLDCNFQSEVNANLGLSGIILAAAWVALTALKLRALIWVFRLKVPTSGVVVLVLAAAGIAGTPQVMDLDGIDVGQVHLIATWYFAALTAFTLYRWSRRTGPWITCELELGAWGTTVLRRVEKTIWMMWSAFTFAHWATGFFVHDLILTPLYFVPVFLLLALVSQTDRWILATGSGALLAAMSLPTSVAPTAVVLGAALAWQAWMSGRRRLWVTVVLAFFFAAWTFSWQGGPLPDPSAGLTLTAVTVLLAMACFLRLPWALAPIPLALLKLDLDSFGWGVVLLATGFMALLAGVAINWKQRVREVT